MNDIKYDVILPLAIKDVFFVKRVIDYINRNLVGVEKIFIITSCRNFTQVRKRLGGISNVQILDEDKLVEGLSFGSLKRLLARVKSVTPTGWLLQQFLKMGFARSPYAGDFYLSWDADTLPLSKIEFFDNNGSPLINPKDEYNKPYFDLIEILLGLKKSKSYSFIAEHMMFNKTIMCSLLDELEKNSTQGSWYETITSNIDPTEPNCFSEFETYGTYAASVSPDYYKCRHLNTFREGGLIKGPFIDDHSLELMSFDLDTASFEMWHKPGFPWNIPHLFLRVYIKYLKFITNKL